MKVGDTIRIAGWGGTWTVTAIAVTSLRCPMCGERCRQVVALATDGTRITARECRCEVV